MPNRDVTVTVPDGLVYDTVVVIVPMPKGMVPGPELKQALGDRLIAAANEALTAFMADNGITWTGPDRKSRWV